MTPGLLKAYSKGAACGNNWRPHVEHLERLAEVYPAIRDSVADLRSKLDLLTEICETGQGIAQAAEQGE